MYWNKDDEWFPGIVKDEALEQNGTPVVLLAYDDGNNIWHNMEQEDFRPVTVTAKRLRKLTCAALRIILSQKGVSPAGTKEVLVQRCLLTPAAGNTAPAPAPAPAAGNTAPAPAPAPAAGNTAPATTLPLRPGMCIEVFWDEDEVWYPGVVTKQRYVGVPPNIQHQCHYDDGIKHWHDMEVEQHRPVHATESRLKRLTVPVIRSLLKRKGLSCSGNKATLVKRCLQAPAPAPTTAPAPTPTPAPAPAPGPPSASAVTTDITKVETVLTAKCKFGQTHQQRMQMRKKIREERASTPAAREGAAGAAGSEMADEVGSRMTTTQACKQIDRHARAMYGIAARGDGGGYAERDGYNLITFNRKDLLAWGGRPRLESRRHRHDQVARGRNVSSACGPLAMCQHIRRRRSCGV